MLINSSEHKSPQIISITGVSVVICCHNSANLLPITLQHLRNQKTDSKVQWEILVVDNASTDSTSNIAKENWISEFTVPLRIVHESKLGLSFARHRGFSEAKFEIVSFVDDDNWLCPEWVQTVAQVMSEHPEVGACGGYSEAVCEITKPSWFESFKLFYAVGSQGEEGGDVTESRGLLWGAGVSIRKSAWQQLMQSGFQSVLSDRTGTQLMSGGDSELCLALRLSGWRLWFEPSLKLQHFLPIRRLNWKYLRSMVRGSGAATAGLDPYYFAMRPVKTGFRARLGKMWQLKVCRMVIKLLRRPHKLFLYPFCEFEGDASIIEIEAQFGRLSQLLRKRKTNH